MRLYGTTDKPAGQILNETWVVTRFADIAPNRFWFVLRNSRSASGSSAQPPRDPHPDDLQITGKPAAIRAFLKSIEVFPPVPSAAQA